MPTDDDTLTAGRGSVEGLATTRDAFLGGALWVHQPARGYRAGLDAVLLAASVAGPQEGSSLSVIDVGAGVGVAGLSVAVRLNCADVTLVEREPLLCDLAARNIEDNGFADRMRVVCADVHERAVLPGPALVDAGYDVAICNPPYFELGSHRPSPDALKAGSHAIAAAGLDDWVRFMARMTRAGGTALIVHRAAALPLLLAAMGRRFGRLRVLPLHPRAGEAASRIIIAGIKGSRAPLELLAGLDLHGAGNRFTPGVDRVLKSPLVLEAGL